MFRNIPQENCTPALYRGRFRYRFPLIRSQASASLSRPEGRQMRSEGSCRSMSGQTARPRGRPGLWSRQELQTSGGQRTRASTGEPGHSPSGDDIRGHCPRREKMRRADEVPARWIGYPRRRTRTGTSRAPLYTLDSATNVPDECGRTGFSITRSFACIRLERTPPVPARGGTLPSLEKSLKKKREKSIHSC